MIVPFMWWRARPLALTGAAIVTAEALVAVAGAAAIPLAVAALVLAPGLALVPLLPPRARGDLVTSLAAAPVLGFAASAVALVTVSSVGLALDDATVRLVPAALVVAGLLIRGTEPPLVTPRRDALAGAGLLFAVVVGMVFEGRVLAGSPVPGNDWGKYVLYADEIRRHGALLIDNPYWLLGVPFREDPGTPALYGSFLLMTGEHAAVLMHGIWVFAVVTILAVFVLVRSFWGPIAGVVAALLWAVLPISHDILAWHGLPNQAALALLALVLLFCGALLVDRLPGTAAVGFALTLLGLAATHRLSLLMGLGAVAITVAAAFVLGDLRRSARTLVHTAVAALVLGGGLAYDLVERQRTFGGTLSYADYLSSKFPIGATVRDLSLAFTAAAVVAVVLGVIRARRDRALLPVLGLFVFTLACAYAWVVQLPLAYVRMAYYLPLSLVPLVAVAVTQLPRPRHAVAAGAAVAALAAVAAWPAAEQVRRFYAFVNPPSLRGLDAVSAQLEPGEVVVTDRCWSFLATWLLHTRTLPGLYPPDIQPRAELARARQAQAILAGTPRGEELARRLGVRFVVVDPTCPDPEGVPIEPPGIGTPVFVSERLVVLRIGAG